MKESTVILTSLYSQIYSPSHRQKERVKEGKKERKKAQQYQWVSIRKRKVALIKMLVWIEHAEIKKNILNPELDWIERTPPDVMWSPHSKTHKELSSQRKLVEYIIYKNNWKYMTSDHSYIYRDEIDTSGSVHSIHPNSRFMWMLACMILMEVYDNIEERAISSISKT